MFSDVWSDHTALFERVIEIHSNPPILYYTALIWQKEASDKSDISRKKSKMCLSFTLTSMEYHDVISYISLSRMECSA